MRFNSKLAAALAIGALPAALAKPCGNRHHNYPVPGGLLYPTVPQNTAMATATATATGTDTIPAGAGTATATTTGGGAVTTSSPTGPTSAPQVPGNQVANSDFEDGLVGWDVDGNVVFSPEGGYPDGGPCVDTGAPTGGLRRRDGATNGLSQDLSSLIVGSNYTFQAWYLVAQNALPQDCQFTAYVDGQVIAASPWFPVQSRSEPSAWKDISGTFVPTDGTASFEAIVSCTDGSPEVFLDQFSWSNQITPADLDHESVVVATLPPVPSPATATTTITSPPTTTPSLGPISNSSIPIFDNSTLPSRLSARSPEAAREMAFRAFLEARRR